MNGWGPKSSVCPSKPRKAKPCGRGDLCQDIPGAPEKLEEKIKLVFNSPSRP